MHQRHPLARQISLALLLAGTGSQAIAADENNKNEPALELSLIHI